MSEAGKQSVDQNIVAAASVIIFRENLHSAPEILMAQRSATLTFWGAATVFPGGKVEAADRELAARISNEQIEDTAARIAAIREALEETGLMIGMDAQPDTSKALRARTLLGNRADLSTVLESVGWSLQLDRLIPFAHWIPSFKKGRIFDTRFYITKLESGNAYLSPDPEENTRVFWIAPAKALDAYENGTLKMIYPTLRNLERLAMYDSFAAAVDHARATPYQIISPWVERRDEIDVICFQPDAGYPISVAPFSQSEIA